MYTCIFNSSFDMRQHQGFRLREYARVIFPNHIASMSQNEGPKQMNGIPSFAQMKRTFLVGIFGVLNLEKSRPPYEFSVLQENIPSLKLTFLPLKKWMVGIRSFPFGSLPIFICELLVSGREIYIFSIVVSGSLKKRW